MPSDSTFQVRAPLLGFSKDSPPSRHWPRVHSQTVSRPSARGCQPRTCSALAVPPGFDGLLRAPIAGLLHPAPDHGVRSVSGSTIRPPCGGANDLNPPRDRASHPSELSPRPQPYRVTAALAFSSFERFPKEAPRSQGFSPLPSPLPHPTLPSTTARCSPGLRSPPGSSPNSPWSIRRVDPKASLCFDADPPLSFAVYTTRRSTKVHQRNPVAFFLQALDFSGLSRVCRSVSRAFSRGRLERNRETRLFRVHLWNRLEYQRRRRVRRIRLQMTNHLRRCRSRIADPHGVCDVKERP